MRLTVRHALRGPFAGAAALTMLIFASPRSVTDAHAVPAGRTIPAATLDSGITLPTGDRVDLRHGVISASSTSSFVHLTVGERRYEFPTAALPQLGRSLDPSLFDLSALARAETGNTIPVQLRGDNAAVTGVLARGSSDARGLRSGRLSAIGERALAARLAASTPPVSAGGYLSLDRGAAKPAPGDFALHTLTLRALTSTGRPDNSGVAFLVNLDDSARLGASENLVIPFIHGIGKVSVPTGHYAVVALSFDNAEGAADRGKQTAIHEVFRSQLLVRADRAITLDARTANHKVLFLTPRPARPRETGFSYLRTPAASDPFFLDVDTADGEPLYLSADQSPITVGVLRNYAYQRMSSPGSSAHAYQYSLLGPTARNRIADAATVVAPASLAAVDLRVFSDITSTGLQQQTGRRRYEDNEQVVRPVVPISLPVERTEYLSADGVQWDGGIAKYTETDPDTGFVYWHDAQYQGVHTYKPGTRVMQDVNRYPLHPAGRTNFGNPASYYAVLPAATRSGNTVSFSVDPMSDNNRLDFSPGTTDSSYAFSVDGNTVDSGHNSKRGLLAPTEDGLPTGVATLGFTARSRESGPKHLLSTRTDTMWTWKSAASTTAVTLPTGSGCADGTGSRNCRVEPLITGEYTVRGQRLDGSTPHGTQVIGLRLSHLQFAASPAITGATARYSLDGTIWRAAVVTGSRGIYRVAFPITGSPGTAHYVDLRVAGADAAGGSITETITRALRVRD